MNYGDSPRDTALFGYIWHGNPETLKRTIGKIIKGASELARYRIESLEVKTQAGIIRYFCSCEDYELNMKDLPMSLISFDTLVSLTQEDTNGRHNYF